MRIGGFLYFAPGLQFSDLNLDSADLGAVWGQRIRGFYIQPASALVSMNHTFASGLVVLSAIDAMSRYEAAPRRYEAAPHRITKRRAGDEFKSFVKAELPSFQLDKDADDLYDKYRNGLVHEARLKEGAEFDLEQNETLLRLGVVIRVNPAKLLEEVEQALVKFVAILANDESSRQFADLLREDFSFELS